jgi:hypothetical protein
MTDHVAINNLCVGLDGNVDANFSVVANISGEITSGNVTLFQVGIPGFNIPGFVASYLEFHTMESNSRVIVVSLILVLNLRYWAAWMQISDFKTSMRASK